MVAFSHVKTPTALADFFIDIMSAEDQQLGAFAQRLRLAFSARLAREEAALELLRSRIRSADPRSILSRGYSLVTDSAGHVLKSASSLRPGDGIRVLFADGTVNAKVI